jgi:hypothetical protein
MPRWTNMCTTKKACASVTCNNMYMCIVQVLTSPGIATSNQFKKQEFAKSEKRSKKSCSSIAWAPTQPERMKGRIASMRPKRKRSSKLGTTPCCREAWEASTVRATLSRPTFHMEGESRHAGLQRCRRMMCKVRQTHRVHHTRRTGRRK